MAKRRIAYMLCRISRPEQSLESQEEMLLQIAKQEGFHIPSEFIFREQKTGYDEFDDDRKSIVELRTAIALKKPDAIFCLEVSRLSRNAIKLQKYIYEFSVTPQIPMYFGDYNMWTIDPKSGERISDNILKLIGAAESVEKERDRIKERTMRGRKSAASKGRFTGHLADGYKVHVNNKFEKVIVIDEARAPIIKRIFELYQTHSTNEIRDILNSEKVPTAQKYRLLSGEYNYKPVHKNRTGDIIDRQNDMWTGSNVRQVLKNEWYIGKRRFMNCEYAVPRIVDDETWQAVQDKKHSYPIIVKKSKNFFLLKNLLYCSCGRKMYGHFQGLNNHYYCSSAHAGVAKCMTRGICKENAESIIYQVIQQKLIYHVYNNEESPISKILLMDSRSLETEKQKIEAYNTVISDAEEQIIDKEQQLVNVLRNMLTSKNESTIKACEKLHKEIESNISGLKGKVVKYKNEIRRINRTIDRRNSAKHIADKICDCTLEEFAELLVVALNRITLFNVDKTTTILKIEYSNGEQEDIIYSPQRYKCRYLLLTKRMFAPSSDLIDINPDLRNILHFPTSIDVYMHTVSYDETKQKIVFAGKGIYRSGDVVFIMDTDLYQERKRILKEKMNINLNFEEIKDEVDVSTFLSLFMQSHGNVYEKEISTSVRAEELREYHRIYRKKYNTGRPSSEEYIDKDDLYDEINSKRKTLYNKIYKIKQKKTLSEKEKSEQIEIIKKQLKEYRLKINYKKDSDRAFKILQNLRKIN